MVWTEEEIAAYQPLNDPRIVGLYSTVGIPQADPERRAEYLAVEVLNLGMTDHAVIMGVAAKDGRPAALNLLEKIFVIDSDK